MGKLYYAASNNGFYDSDFHTLANMPADAQEISRDQWLGLMAAQTSGQIIQPDQDGRPQAVDAPPPSVDALWVVYQAQAQLLLDKSDITLLRCLEHQVAIPPEWVSYRAGLRAIVGAESAGDPTQPLPVRPEYPVGS